VRKPSLTFRVDEVGSEVTEDVSDAAGGAASPGDSIGVGTVVEAVDGGAGVTSVVVDAEDA